LVKYLFLYLKTGGGHLAPAKAVAEKIRAKRDANVDIHLVDGLSGSNQFIKKFIESGYKTAVNKAAWTYEFLYALHKFKIIAKSTASIVSYFVKPALERQILENKPEKIVIFHFFLIKPVNEIIKKYKLSIKVITVVTDPFTAHPIWFLQKGQNFIVFSDLLKEKCIEQGINSENLKVFPFVLDNKFSRKIPEFHKQKIRRQLGFKTDSKIILIMGGGDGMPKGKKILKHLVTSNMQAEICIVCGNNRKLFKQAIHIRSKYQAKNLKVYGFIDFVHSLISISDVVITKCGASTFMEILMMEKIPVINNYIWEQEKGNMEYVCNKKMGVLEKKVSQLPVVLQNLMNDNELSSSLRSNIRNASITNGVGKVSNYILTFQ
jgi:processive 1,2-diacylglycerol beta-glucosyltransferase/1,2-diacylglycerol 3-beta-galactosyltransferase